MWEGSDDCHHGINPPAYMQMQTSKLACQGCAASEECIYVKGKRREAQEEVTVGVSTRPHTIARAHTTVPCL